MFNFFWNIFRKETEFNRQLAHLAFGLLYAVGYALDYVTVLVSGLMLLLALLFAIFLKKRRSFLDRIVLILEREDHFWNVPLRGLIFFLLGCTLTIAYFDFLPALTGIVVLSVTDSIGTLYGKYMGVVKIKWNPNKHMEGPVLGGAVSTLMCLAFLPFTPAFFASYAGALLDTFSLKILGVEIDDNLIIPLVAAGIVKLMS